MRAAYDPVTTAAPHPGRGPTPLALVLLTVCYFLIARASLLLAFATSNATPVWPPSGIALAAVVAMGYRAGPAILLGALAANLATFTANGVPFSAGLVTASLLIATGNTLEALAGAWLMRRHTDTAQPLSQLQDVYKFALIAMAMCVVSAGIGSITLVVGGLVPASAYATVVLTWWVGDTAGVLVVAPAILAWLRPGAGGAPQPPRQRWAEALLSLAALSALVALVFGRRYSAGDGLGWLPYVFMLCVAQASYRFGLRGASLACLLTAGGAVLGSVSGLGPFAVGTLNDSLIALESFVVLCSLIGMVLCADASERRRMNASVRDHSAAQWATLLVGFGLTVAVWHLVALSTERRAREQFDAECAEITERIERRMDLYEAGLRGAQALFKAEPAPSRAQFRDFADGLDLPRNFPGVLGLGYAAWLRTGQHEALEERVHRQDNWAGFHIWAAPGSPYDRSMSAVVLYLEPSLGRNRRAFGYDMMSEPIRRAALLEAARTGAPVLSAKVVLVQDAPSLGQPGFLLYVPVYRTQARLPDSAGTEQRMAALQGFAYSPIRADDLMAGLLGNADSKVQLEIFDGAGTAPADHLYTSVHRGADDLQKYPNPYRQTTPLTLLQHGWTLRFTSLPAFENSIDRQKSHIVLLAGAIISLLFFGVVRALTARQAYASALAEEKTAALRESESSLIVARDLAEAANRAKGEFVANMSHELRTPMNAVLGMAYLLGHTELKAEQKKYVDMIRSSGQSLLGIMNDILDYSKVEAGKMELSENPLPARRRARRAGRHHERQRRREGPRTGDHRRTGRAAAARWRRAAGAAGAGQPGRQCDQIHRARRSAGHGRTGRARGRARHLARAGARHRHRHGRSAAGAPVLGLRPGRLLDHAPLWRHRPGADHFTQAGRDDGRLDHA
jgi:CHASE1-domain containing sensor protein/integral membrane sensor domain MASE1